MLVMFTSLASIVNVQLFNTACSSAVVKFNAFVIIIFLLLNSPSNLSSLPVVTTRLVVPSSLKYSVQLPSFNVITTGSKEWAVASITFVTYESVAVIVNESAVTV